MPDIRYIYCVFCETGKEEIVKLLYERVLGLQAIVPLSTRFRFFRGQHKRVVERLLPSYIFLYLDREVEIHRLAQIEHVFRVLSMTGDYQLHKRDQAFASWLYRQNGLVGTSQAYREGDHIVVVDGPLRDYEGDIVWVDKRKGKAKVHLVTESLDTSMWFYFEYIKNPAQQPMPLFPEASIAK